MASAAPLQAHFTADRLTIRDASTLAVVAEIPATNFPLERISSGMLLTLNILVDSIHLERGLYNLDLATGDQE